MKMRKIRIVFVIILMLIIMGGCDVELKRPYQIIMFDDLGSVYEVIEFADYLGELPILSKDGYEFLGWYLDGELIDPETLDIRTRKENLYLMPWWEKTPDAPYTMTLIFGDSQVEISYLYHDDISQWLINPSKDGYVFEGWYQGDVEFVFGVSEVTDGMVLTARLSKLFQVKYLDNGEIVKELTVKENEYVPFEPRESTEQHVFIGWYLGEEQFDFENTKISSDLELIAKYLDYHKVAFYDGEELVFETLIEDKAYLEPYELGYEKENLIFGGWEYLGEVFDFANVPVTSDLVMYAIWEEDPVTLATKLLGELTSFVVDYLYPAENLHQVNAIVSQAAGAMSASESVAEIRSIYQAALAELQVVPTYPSMLADFVAGLREEDYFEREWQEITLIQSEALNEMYHYSGGVPSVERLYQNALSAINNVVTKAADIENAEYLKAIKVRQLENLVAELKPYQYQEADWELIQTYKGQGIEAINEAIGTVAVGEAYGNAVNAIQSVEKNERRHFTVNYLVDGDVYKTAEVIEGELAPVQTAPDKEGYHFLGWYLGEEMYDFDTPVLAAFDLVAKYEKDFVETFIVTFMVDNQVYETQEVEIGLIVKAPLIQPEREGFEFVGWYLEGELYNFYTPVTRNLVIEARFEEKSSLPTVPDLPINEGDFEITPENFLLAYRGTSTEIMVPARVTTIFPNAFQGTPVEKIWFENGSNLTEVWDMGFANSNVTHVYFHNTQLLRIMNNAFVSCQALEEVYFPQSLTEIGDDVFVDCPYLRYVNLEYTSITILPNHLFMNNDALVSIIIPETVMLVRNSFFECHSLISITFLSINPPMIEGELIEGPHHPDLVIYVPAGTLDLYVNAERWKDLANKGIIFLETSNTD
ncbi:MAG: InlB B-repeat-containing protein [Bacilli bacterium]|nr:InlB B-repeat-containing protein [Bacilli bacterium]